MKTTEIEQSIVFSIIAVALAEGFTISVYDGEEYPLTNSTDPKAINDAMFSTDSDVLVLSKGQPAMPAGSIVLIYGNGCDVISDHSVSLSRLLLTPMELSEKFAGMPPG
jgi:hypothetical protein